MWLIEKYVDVPALADLPPLDLERPLPWDQTVPLGYAAAYVALHETFHQVWRAKPVLAEMVGEVATEFGLSGDVQRGHVIGYVAEVPDVYLRLMLYMQSALSRRRQIQP